MVSRTIPPISSPARASRPSPLNISAVRPSPTAVGSLPSYPVTSSPFSSSPILSSTQGDSLPSPDLFEDFEYSQEMDPDLRRIDAEAEHDYAFLLPSHRISANSPPSTLVGDQKTWVVFRGNLAGVYDNAYVSLLRAEWSARSCNCIAYLQPCRPQGSATLSRGATLTANPLGLLGLPSLYTEYTLTMVKAPGLFSSAVSPVFLSECKYFKYVSRRIPPLTHYMFIKHGNRGLC